MHVTKAESTGTVRTAADALIKIRENAHEYCTPAMKTAIDEWVGLYCDLERILEEGESSGNCGG